MAAYEDFLRAREFENRGRRPEVLAASQRLYERAIERDPAFVEARARLAWSHLLTYWLGYDRSPERVERARVHTDYLRANAPDAAATHSAMGFLRYYGEYDFAGAAAELEALEILESVRARPSRLTNHALRLDPALRAGGTLRTARCATASAASAP